MCGTVSACCLLNWEKISQKSNESLSFFIFFSLPLWTDKMRQFAKVWLPSQSSCRWHWVHHNPPTPSSVAQYMHPSLRSLQVFLAQHGTCWTFKKPTGLSWALTGRPPVFHSWFWVRSISKTQETSVYRHSGPFIHKLAVLIQLRESSWTIQSLNSARSVDGQRDAVCRVRPGEGARCTDALNFTWVKEEVMIGHCQVM